MVALIFADDQALSGQVTAACPAPKIVSHSWWDTLRRAGHVGVCVLGALEIGEEIARRIMQLRSATSAPILLVAPLDASASGLGAILVDGVIWLHLIEAQLGDEIHRLNSRSLRAQFAAAMRRACVDHDFGARLADLCVTDPIPADVNTAARILAQSPRNARRKLHEAFDIDSEHATDYLLCWLRLLCVCDPSKARLKQFAAVNGIRRTPRAAQQLARRLTGRTLQDVRVDPNRLLRDALRAFGLP